MKKLHTKSGFTLIELIIVFAIIGIMAISAIGSYSQVRASAELSLQVDEIVSELRKTQSKAQNSGNNKCFGLRFDNSTENAGIFYTEAEYKNPVSKCSVEEVTNSYYEKNLKTHKIIDGTTRNPDNINILFVPPKGEIFIPDFPAKEIVIELSIKEKTNNQQIVINQVNGTIQKRTKSE